MSFLKFLFGQASDKESVAATPAELPDTLEQPDTPEQIVEMPAADPVVEAVEPEAPQPCNLTGTTIEDFCEVTSGDSIVIDGISVRIDGIDAPKPEQPWGYKAKAALTSLCDGQKVSAEITGALSEGRVAARCTLPDGRDLAVEIVRRGFALDWATYSGGKYRRFETADARRKLWRSARRHVDPDVEVKAS